VSLVDSGARAGSGPNAAETPRGGTDLLRPDAYVSIRGVAGGRDQQTGIEAWFCELEGSLSGRLADLVLEEAQAVLPVPRESQDGQGNGRVEDPDGFQCDMLLAGRAHMAAVLLELPPVAFDGPLARERMARGVASGIEQFFQRYGDLLLREEHQRRMVWPAIGPITSYFGPAHPLGIDIGQSEGPVVATTDGTVAFVGALPVRGNSVILDHGAGVFSAYHHLAQATVALGQSVAAGDLVGTVGSSGLATGPHLHWEVIVMGVNVDPVLWTYEDLGP